MILSNSSNPGNSNNSLIPVILGVDSGDSNLSSTLNIAFQTYFA